VATLKQLRRRIRSVESTQQITKAMEMVAAAKLRRAQQRAEAIRPFSEKMQQVLQSLAQSSDARTDPLFAVREVKRKAYILLASDKGLCGSYNANIFRHVESGLKSIDPGSVYLIPVGRRAREYFRRRQWEMTGEFTQLGDQLDPVLAMELGRLAVQMYQSEEVDQVDLVYTHFITAASRTIVEEPLLPIKPPEGAAAEDLDYIFEPSAKEILSSLLPRYVEGQIRSAIADALASEHSARMLSMGNATRNAKDMIRSLTLLRNRLRQAAITKELGEIVGGAEALK
jgi:F-type H+-transporting ATPase subunit gamma